MKLGQCQVEGCYSPAEYGLYRTKPDGQKEWLYVCWLHQKFIGNENVHLAGGRYERKQSFNETSEVRCPR